MHALVFENLPQDRLHKKDLSDTTFSRQWLYICTAICIIISKIKKKNNAKNISILEEQLLKPLEKQLGKCSKL